MSNFDLAVAYILKNEGLLSENPHDKGGITKYGISLRLLKSLDPDILKQAGIFDLTIDEDTIRHLTLDQAKAIYRLVFWDVAPFARINNQAICNYVFDIAVNMGISPAIKCVQRALWAKFKDRHVVLEDGILGNHTLSLLSTCDLNFISIVRSERAGEYRLIAQNDPIQTSNLNGWLNRAYEG